MPMADVEQAFFGYTDSGSPAALRRLHDAIMSDSTFTRDTPWLPESRRLLEQDRWDEAIRVIRRFMPGAFMSPEAHQMLSFAYSQIHEAEQGRYEAFCASTAIEAISESGSGTQRSPWLVLHVADEYAFMASRSMQSLGQRVVSSTDGLMDVHQCADRTERWFALVP